MKPLPLHRVLRSWLLSDGSLSQRLARAFGHFEVQVLHQGTARASAEELRLLRLHGQGRTRLARCHVREVVLWGDGRALVHARSVLPAVQARLAWRALQGLGTRPLADLLFGPHAARCTRLGAHHAVPLQARRQGQRLGWARPPLWGRRSIFMRRGVPLLITEWFAPTVCDHTPGARSTRGQPHNNRLPHCPHSR